MFEEALKINDADMRKLTKILEMTTSDCPAEALTATRKASHILTKYDTDYHTLLKNLQDTSSSHYKRRINDLEKRIDIQKNKIAKLMNEHSMSDKEPKHLRFLGPIQGLRKYLMRNLNLRSYELSLLENCGDILPKSKEAYMVLICARRYGVDYISA